ncbi:DinB family protein [Ktedonobacter racemifer]|uniref:DinB-like domain-containing protein n=1 Tax=Ktedonobacter racemifer DSM 44963 TaxID=485913 RepID=D6TDG8_KTERA|nr:DinB family protein [Ktedonobacter racemifer]EFH88313.1 hypothetical protein Krac_9745 [Ktedonobacter racemifer DSM 44963]
MPHPLVVQLRFTRSEFKRALLGFSDADAHRRVPPMNCISWNIGHLAWQEQLNWLTRMQGQTPLPQLNELVGYEQAACTPPLAEMWTAWHTVTQLVDPFLDTLTTQKLQEVVHIDEEQRVYTPGVVLQRIIYHYWYHLGENMAIRQMLGHTDLPEFVGDIEAEAPYLPHF